MTSFKAQVENYVNTINKPHLKRCGLLFTDN